MVNTMVQKIISILVVKIATIIRYCKYGRYKKKYGFNSWHMMPKLSKPYVKDIVRYICAKGIDANTCIVECGCGLCDIVGDKAFKNCRRFGVEKEESVYLAASKIYGGRVTFINGTFQDIKNMNIDWFIAVNFTHTIPPGDMANNFRNLSESSIIKYFVLDEVTGNYKYTHDYDVLMPEGYILESTLGPYPSAGGKRHIKIFRNIEVT